MIRQSGILFFITLELLFLPTFQTTINFFRITFIRYIKPLNHKEILIMHNILRINRIRSTLTERQIIDRIQ